MPLSLPSLTALDASEVTQARNLLIAGLLDFGPATETRRGAVGDLSVQLFSILYAAFSQLQERVRRSSTLLAVEEASADLDAETLDGLLANYRLSREQGSKASGLVSVVTGTPVDWTINQGDRFEIGGLTYLSQQTYRARADAAQAVGEYDLEYVELSPGRHAVTFAVEAEQPGQIYNQTHGAVTAVLAPPATFLAAYVESDLAGGTDVQDAQALLQRARSGLAARGLISAAAVESQLRGGPLPDLVAASVIRSGDPEQQRHNSLLPIPHAGRVDVYLRTQPIWDITSLTKTATLVEKRVTGSVWQITLSRTEAAGLLEVHRVYRSNRPAFSGYQVLSDTRGWDTSEEEGLLLPDIASAAQAAYSPYQTAVLQILDTDADVTDALVNVETAEYQLELRTVTGLAEGQASLASARTGVIAGDVLVRAAVPCFLSVNFTLVRPATVPKANLTSLKQLVADTVNSLPGWTGKLDASRILGAIYRALPSGQVLRDLDLYGRIRRPDGTQTFVRDRQIIEVPDEPSRMVSRRTVGFYLRPDDVAIETSVES